MADRGQASSFTAAAAPADGYQHPFVAADDFGEARKYTALGSFLEPPTGGELVRFAASQVAGTSTASGDLRLATALTAAAAGSAAVSGQLLFETLTLAGNSAGGATISGHLGLAGQATGGASGQSSMSGDLRAVRGVAGQAAGAGEITGWLYVPGLAVKVDASAQVSGGINLATGGVGGARGRAAGGATVVAALKVLAAAAPVPPGELIVGEALQQPSYFR
jgi:hypothetical protein